MQFDGPPLVTMLAGTFVAVTVLLLVVAAASTPAALAAAVPFAAAATLLWYHASGRLTRRLRRTADREYRGATTGPRGGRSRRAREQRERARRRTAESRQRQRRRRRQPEQDREAALDVLGLDSPASQGEIEQAYRARVKEVHPDKGGDERTFRRVTEAYERLSEES